MDHFIILLLFLRICEAQNVTYLTKSSQLEVNPNGDNLEIFCYNGSTNKASINTIWLSSTLILKNMDSNNKIFTGEDEQKVIESYKLSQVFLTNPLNYFLGKFSGSRNKFSLNPFNTTCIGVVSLKNYSVELSIKNLDLYPFILFIFGIILYILADNFSKSIIFYYGSGVFIGIFASVLIAAFILSRYFPKKGPLFTFLTAGLTLSAYIYEYLATNMLYFMQEYWNYILIYILTMGTISFAICYYQGPISNPRAIDILRWGIRFLGILLIYFNCNFYQIAVLFIVTIIILTFLNDSSVFRSILKRLRMRYFPKKRRLLTEDEYLEEASVETRKALEELRVFCRSPKCDAWKITSRISTPRRFAEWVDGSVGHITDEELFEYEHSRSPTIIPSTLCYDD